MRCHECEKERKHLNDRGVCRWCSRSIRQARTHGRRKEREDREAEDRRREILRPRTRSIQWVFHTAEGQRCVQPTAGVPSMGDTVYRVEGITGFNFLMPDTNIDADTLYLTQWVEAWKRLIRQVTPRGTRKTS